MFWRKILLDLAIRSQSSSAFFSSFFSLYPYPLAWFSFHSRSLPPLDPGTLPNSYITLGKTLNDAPLAVRDLDAERVMESSLSLSTPAPPAPPPELTKSGKPLTKKEKKAVSQSRFILSMHYRTNALVSSRKKPPVPNGSAFPLPPKRIYLDCTRNMRRCVCATNLIRSGFTVRIQAKDAVSKAFPNTLQ
jgi:hypothetical protein